MISKPSSGPRGSPPSRPAQSRLQPPSETLIFIVDDDQTIVDALDHFLSERGYRTQVFLDPRAALETIGTVTPHLLIVDRNMPGMGGFDLARTALEEDPDIGVVILTGAREVELAIEAFQLGASDYLLKPLDFGRIEKTVRRVLIRRGQEIFHRDTETGCDWRWSAGPDGWREKTASGRGDGWCSHGPGGAFGTEDSPFPGTQRGRGTSLRKTRRGTSTSPSRR